MVDIVKNSKIYKFKSSSCEHCDIIVGEMPRLYIDSVICKLEMMKHDNKMNMKMMPVKVHSKKGHCMNVTI